MRQVNFRRTSLAHLRDGRRGPSQMEKPGQQLPVMDRSAADTDDDAVLQGAGTATPSGERGAGVDLAVPGDALLKHHAVRLDAFTLH